MRRVRFGGSLGDAYERKEVLIEGPSPGFWQRAGFLRFHGPGDWHMTGELLRSLGKPPGHVGLSEYRGSIQDMQALVRELARALPSLSDVEPAQPGPASRSPAKPARDPAGARGSSRASSAQPKPAPRSPAKPARDPAGARGRPRASSAQPKPAPRKPASRRESSRHAKLTSLPMPGGHTWYWVVEWRSSKRAEGAPIRQFAETRRGAAAVIRHLRAKGWVVLAQPEPAPRAPASPREARAIPRAPARSRGPARPSPASPGQPEPAPRKSRERPRDPAGRFAREPSTDSWNDPPEGYPGP